MLVEQSLVRVCPIPAHSEPRWDALPASRGVAVFEAPDGRTVLVATGADLRALARRRLDPDHDSGKPTTDLRAVTATVRAATTGSTFESDLLFLELARARLPHVYRSVIDRSHGWFVGVDLDAEFPRFEKASTSVMSLDEPGRRWFGPIGDKHRAARFRELLEDLFDLCRYHEVLVQAPRGTACVYKEMGKCPAPCDGSESMDDYRARVGRAAQFAASGGRLEIETLEGDMGEAAASMDFERAERLRRWLERAKKGMTPSLRRVRDLEAFRFVAVAPSEHPDHARLVAIRGGAWQAVMDVRCDEAGAAAALNAFEHLEAMGEPNDQRAALDRIGLLSSWMERPARRRGGVEFVRAEPGCDRPLAKAIRTMASRAEEESEDERAREVGLPPESEDPGP